ncbi:hypothetical protein L1987_40274 [Smallanthus sonchifolius]|uniref:Uncharacterized protein n=1 Tax=Smallanthus sonchifolius TaxID=185202 RepID=A0ACB9GSZ1_9ASTR|nr:hypothetical protein L1987_40274 [Smallanthus sonchifolius]
MSASLASGVFCYDSGCFKWVSSFWEDRVALGWGNSLQSRRIDSPHVEGISSRNLARGSDGISKKMGVLELHLVLSFPSKFRTTLRFSTDFDNRNTTSLELFDFTIHDFYRSLNEVHRFINVHVVKRYVKIFVSKAFLQIRHMKCRIHIAK